MAMNQRNKAEKELIDLREQLKHKLINEDMYKHNLRNALAKNSIVKLQNQRSADPNLPVINIYEKPRYDVNPRQYRDLYPPYQQQPSINKSQFNQNNYKNPINLAAAIRSNSNKQMNLEDTQALDANGSLVCETNFVPLSLFNDKNSENLTLSKIQNMALRPSSSNVWEQDLKNNHRDVLYDFVQESQANRPSSQAQAYISRQKSNQIMFNNLETKKEDDTKSNIIMNRWKSRSDDTKESLSQAGRNIIGRNNLAGAGNNNGPIIEKEHGINLDANMFSIDNSNVHERVNGTRILQNMETPQQPIFNTETNNQSILNNTNLNTTLNIENIHMANDIRLKQLESLGYGSMAKTGKPELGKLSKKPENYYSKGNMEEITEDDDELARLDKLLIKLYRKDETNQGTLG